MFKKHILPLILFTVYSLLKASWRIRIVEPESFKQAIRSNEPMVLAHWHGDEFGIVYLFKRYRACAMVSTSQDGDLMDKVARLFGAKTSRGSSTRGGTSALKGILRLAREGYRPSIAVDGPKGPLHKVKPGVFEISKLTGGKIYPLTASASPKHVFERAWNKSFLPLPFAKVVVVWGEPLPAVERSTDSRDPKLAESLEKALNDAKRLASNLIAAP